MTHFNCLGNLLIKLWLALLISRFVNSKVAFYESDNYIGKKPKFKLNISERT